MGNSSSAPPTPGSDSTQQPATTTSPQKKVGIKTGKPICCCCPETKLPRDECILNFGEEHSDCIKLIEAHKACLREEGFDVK